VELLPGFQDDCWFSTGHFADVMMGFGHDAEASSCRAFMVRSVLLCIVLHYIAYLKLHSLPHTGHSGHYKERSVNDV
jgi:hypothetical protein